MAIPLRNGFRVHGYAQDASPEASPAAVASPATAGSASPTGAPDAGTARQTRGAGKELRLIVWQAPTVAAPHSALSDKDFLAAAPVVEPVLQYLPDGTLVANLVEHVPTVENGLLAADLTTATFVFREKLMWSDGTPVTANDLIFTWKWITTESNAANSIGLWTAIKSIEAKDDRTAIVTFKKPSATWFEPFSGNYNGNLYPAHVFKNDPTNKNDAFLLAPIGTGPYVMTEFKANDYRAIQHQRALSRRHQALLQSIYLKGGGDPTSAGRAVLQTGDFDYAWNLQVEPEILAELSNGSEFGKIFSSPGTTVESLNFNFSDPRKDVDGQKSQKDTPHPIFATPGEVRQALNMAVDRKLITDKLYGKSEHPTANLLAGLASFTSPNTTWTFDLDMANKALDAAGWTREGDVRSKDGVKFSFNYWTSITPVRQKTAAIVKADWRRCRRDPPHRGRGAALRRRDGDGDDAGRGGHRRGRRQLHQGLLHRPGDGRPPPLQGQAQPPPAGAAAERPGRARRGAAAGREGGRPARRRRRLPRPRPDRAGDPAPRGGARSRARRR